jgi:hypothetical protein
MPIYQYPCGACSRINEDIRQIRDMDLPFLCGGCGVKCARAEVPGTVPSGKTGEPETKRRPSAIAGRAPAAGAHQITGVHMQNMDRGIVVGAGVNVEIKDTTFDNVRVPIEHERRRQS